ncbi:MAG TPA: hypothetical protein VF622_10300, partial [Segetibacter sp.]
SHNIKEGQLLTFLSSSEFYNYKNSQKATPEKCITCADFSVCGGGMKLHRWKDENGFNNHSVYCHDQLYLIRNMRQSVVRYYEDARVKLY